MRIDQGFPVFYGKDGTPLKSGKAYIGTVNEDAETHLVNVFYDDALTIAANNPLQITNGLITRRGLPVAVFTALEFSITVKDNNGVLQFSSLNGSPISVDDIVASLEDDLDNVFVKKSGDVMTGPLAVADAIGPNDIYSRSQLDNLLSYRPAATYVVNSIQKWIDLGNNVPGNDYTDVLVKRGTWNVLPITLPATCKRLRGELGAELYFAPSTTFNYGVNIADGQTTEVTQLLFTVEISQSNNTNNTQKTAVVARDGDVHDIEIAFIIQGGAANLGNTTFIGVASANGVNIVVNAYNKDAAVFISAACVVVGLSIVTPSAGLMAIARNVVISQYSPTIQSKGRYGTFSCSSSAFQWFVWNPTVCDNLISWRTPRINRVGLNSSAATTLNLVYFSGSVSTSFATQLILEGTMNIGGNSVTIVFFQFDNTSTHRVGIGYKFALFISALTATVAPNNTYTGLFGVTGAIAITGSGVFTVTNVVFSATVVDIVINVSGAVTTTNGIQTCRQVKNCIVTINAGTKYAADAYYSSDTSAAAANTATGGWNN